MEFIRFNNGILTIRVGDEIWSLCKDGHCYPFAYVELVWSVDGFVRSLYDYAE